MVHSNTNLVRPAVLDAADRTGYYSRDTWAPPDGRPEKYMTDFPLEDSRYISTRPTKAMVSPPFDDAGTLTRFARPNLTYLRI